MKASKIVEQALKHMRDRAATYDRPDGERSIGATVEAFNAVTGDGLMNTEERGWLFMLLLKAVRSQQGDYRADSYEDGAAYFGLMGEAAFKERAASKKEPVPSTGAPQTATEASGFDWSKAPDKATHFCPETEECFAYWLSIRPGESTYERLIIHEGMNNKWHTLKMAITEDELKTFIARPSV
jgi:hypothetical protein